MQCQPHYNTTTKAKIAPRAKAAGSKPRQSPVFSSAAPLVLGTPLYDSGVEVGVGVAFETRFKTGSVMSGIVSRPEQVVVTIATSAGRTVAVPWL